MKDGEEFRETCTGCGRVADHGHSFCHFYTAGKMVSFCSPACAERFLELPAELHLGVGAREADLAEAATALAVMAQANKCASLHS